MKLFVDTANVDEIRQANDMGVICGVTTNPSLIAKEGRDFVEVVKEITTIVDGPISAEVISLEADKMVEEAKPLAAINKNIVIKIPMCAEGLKAVKKLTALGIKTNVTLIFSAAQALLAARAGATYVSPFLGRLDDIGTNGMILIEEIADIFKIHEIPTEIIAASIRNPIHVIDAARAGCDIATVPYKVIAQMLHHPLIGKQFRRTNQAKIKAADLGSLFITLPQLLHCNYRCFLFRFRADFRAFFQATLSVILFLRMIFLYHLHKHIPKNRLYKVQKRHLFSSQSLPTHQNSNHQCHLSMTTIYFD